MVGSCFFVAINLKINQPSKSQANSTLTPASCGFTVTGPVEGRWCSFSWPGDATTKAAIADSVNSVDACCLKGCGGMIQLGNHDPVRYVTGQEKRKIGNKWSMPWEVLYKNHIYIYILYMYVYKLFKTVYNHTINVCVCVRMFVCIYSSIDLI